MNLAGGFHHKFIALSQAALFDSDQRYDAEVVVKPGVNDQSLQRLIIVAYRWRVPLMIDEFEAEIDKFTTELYRK